MREMSLAEVRGASTAASHWPVSEFSRCGGLAYRSGHPAERLSSLCRRTHMYVLSTVHA